MMAAMSVPEVLLELQQIDTVADQLRHRRERLAERPQLAAACEQLSTWEKRRRELTSRNDELADAIESAERESAELVASKARLEAQLKTIITPREAEALMAEIEGIDQQREVLDTSELTALEEQVAVDDELGEHIATERPLRAAVQAAEQALESAESDIDRELADLETDRLARRAELPDAVLAKYDRVRSNLGVAVARLDGKRCDGCHLDLSAAEVDTAKEEAAATGLTDCPQCGRILVV